MTDRGKYHEANKHPCSTIYLSEQYPGKQFVLTSRPSKCQDYLETLGGQILEVISDRRKNRGAYQRLSSTIVLDDVQSKECGTKIYTTQNDLCHKRIVDPSGLEDHGTVVDLRAGSQ